ncbi:death ligand signal enhancer isoform X2 [Halichoeres trimaculatus]|uniref:death ligand signal enhancer isoform X2 n=1 Tax=Halichoeres trimaculatus TaxID=147232 RepID=UPI003D9F539E
MWRVHGFVGRVLHRCQGSVPLRLSQSQHVEDEVINSSTVLSTSRHSFDSSSQKGEDGERRKKQRTFQFDYTELPRYTALDAVGWGAAAALFMQICRRIHSQLSSGTELSPTPGALTAPSTLHKCGYHILLEALSRRDVLPRGRKVACLPEKQSRDQPAIQTSSSSNSSSSDPSLHSSSQEGHHAAVTYSISDQQGALLNQDSSLPGLFFAQNCPEESLQSASCSLQNDDNRDNIEKQDAKDKGMLSGEEKLAGAAMNLRHVEDTSIPVVLNIMGLENAKSEKYEEAFVCFIAAARHGYSKAQFNTGVCYEKGRGVTKDKKKALYYYQQAAAGGHRQAQYRYAKLLLTSRRQQSLEELNRAINLLEQAASAGITEAQVCLASVYSQEPVRDSSKSVQYLKMAAESGDSSALLLLGQCFESGFGVQQNLSTAIEYYKRATQAGNKHAKSLLRPASDTDSKEDAVLRSIRSAPCFSVAESRLQLPLSARASRIPLTVHPPVTLQVLPHSWSTGSLCVPAGLSAMPLHLHPNSSEGGACRWTVGIG